MKVFDLATLKFRSIVVVSETFMACAKFSNELKIWQICIFWVSVDPLQLLITIAGDFSRINLPSWTLLYTQKRYSGKLEKLVNCEFLTRWLVNGECAEGPCRREERSKRPKSREIHDALHLQCKFHSPALKDEVWSQDKTADESHRPCKQKRLLLARWSFTLSYTAPLILTWMIGDKVLSSALPLRSRSSGGCGWTAIRGCWGPELRAAPL